MSKGSIAANQAQERRLRSYPKKVNRLLRLHFPNDTLKQATKKVDRIIEKGKQNDLLSQTLQHSFVISENVSLIKSLFQF